MFSSAKTFSLQVAKCETFALQVVYAWAAEPFSKLGGTSARQKN